MKTEDRITRAPACNVIKLSEAEKDIYRGSGRKLAQFEKGEMIKLLDLLDYSDPDAALTAALEFAKEAEEVWLVMCSCYELCDPRRIHLTDARGIADLAHLLRVIREEYEQAYAD